MKVASMLDVLIENIKRAGRKRMPPIYKELVKEKAKKIMHGNIPNTKGCKIDVRR